MSKIYNVVTIRGSNGAGKTTMVRALMQEMTKVAEHRTEVGIHADIFTNRDGEYVSVLGGYPVGVMTGGLDRVRDITLVRPAVSEMINWGHILMEGMVYSALQTRAKHVVEEIAGRGVSYQLFINMPYEEQLANVIKRRAASGNTSPFDPERNIRPKHHAVELCRRKLVKWGFNVAHLDYDNTMACARRMLKIGKEEEL